MGNRAEKLECRGKRMRNMRGWETGLEEGFIKKPRQTIVVAFWGNDTCFTPPKTPSFCFKVVDEKTNLFLF